MDKPSTPIADTESRGAACSAFALSISGLRQVIRIPGGGESFTLHVRGRLRVPQGAFVGVLGQTGCGKTTLLTVLGLLRGSQPGSVLDEFKMHFREDDAPISLVEIWRRNGARAANGLRRRHFGFALQHGELLPSLTVAENIAFPLRINGWPRGRIRQRVAELTEAFRLYRSFDEGPDDAADGGHADSPVRRVSSLASARIHHLSGGQYQRVGLARAAAHQPEFLFVDEPTASLNRSVARVALRHLSELRSHDGRRSTIFMVTHDEAFAQEFCDLIIRMRPLATDTDGGPAGEVIFEPNEELSADPRSD